ncbi:hypothetical protein [Pseudoxanthomonas spadix]|uniref:hypothetical protein n=1 Tax=Pseudoxanthomonas spadix TaxID=415229 RepID=UPI001B340D01|nr:hypothetical protein [Pseudoxanthomonas spadix]MBP3975636.1 hypothetical protein [Pseudoxanthomonas spadix]
MTDAITVPAVRTIAVKGVVIGEGMPRIIVPITAATAAGALAQAGRIGANAGTDLGEWRIGANGVRFTFPTAGCGRDARQDVARPDRTADRRRRC